MDTVWTVLHSLWTGLWEAVDSAVGDTPEDVARPALTSDNGGAHGVDEKLHRRADRGRADSGRLGHSWTETA